MTKSPFSVVLVLTGVGLWVALSNTAQFSIKKWDAKFDSSLRHGLTQLGLSDKNLLSSLHEIRNDAHGEWVVHKIDLQLDNPNQINKIKSQLKKSGAQISEKVINRERVFFVKRGSRLYQEIHFIQP